MKPSEFPLEKTNQRLSELSKETDRPAPYRHVESPEAEVAAAPAYDNLLDYWYILVRHKMALLRFAAGGLIAAILFSLAQTPLYRARTSLEIQDFNDDFLGMKNVDPTSTGNYLSAQSYFQTQIKMLQSESLLERVIQKLNLDKGSLQSRRSTLFGSSNARRLPEKEALIQQVKDNLTVRAAGETRLLEVLYDSPDPKLSADFANTLVSEFIEQSQEMRWQSTQRTAEWLTGHLGDMKAKLEQSEAQLQDYAHTSGLSFTSENDNLAEDRLKELQDEFSKAQADRIAKQAKFEEAKSKPADSLPEMLEDPTMREYRQKLIELQRQYAELSATLTPAHYKVQRVQAQITELQSAIQKERTNVLRRIGDEYAAALRRERLLSEGHAEQEKVVADQSDKAIHYNTLKREVDSSRRLYEAMLERVKQAGLAAAMRASNVLVVDSAKPPRLPYRPRVFMNSALGLFSGVFLGLGFVLLRECLDRRIRAPGEAQVYLNLPELGAIPMAEIPEYPRISSGFRSLRRLALPSTNTPARSQSGCPELATWNCKPSLLAECVRATLTSILFSGQNGDYYPRVVVVTSPCPGDGKTTVASNLSIAIAETGRKVLLIDGDLRRPRLHKIFSVANSWGLSDAVWADNSSETAPILHLVRETKVPGLSLLPAGNCSLTPPNHLFYSPRMSGLLARLRNEFEMVIIDAPPMIHLADARVLARLADGTILVVRAGQTTTQSALFAAQRFAEDGTRVLGTILNNFDPSTASYYGYGSYNKYFREYGYKGK